jgi:hypothetical protein
MQGSPSRPLQGSPGRPPEEEQRAGDADDEIASLLSTSQQMVAVPPTYEDAEEEAEVAMMREGLAKSQQGLAFLLLCGRSAWSCRSGHCAQD